MPELPEVEAVIRTIRKAARGARITGFRALRQRVTYPQDPAEVERTIGHTIQGVARRGKNIIVYLDGGIALHVHLKMTGNLVVIPDHRVHTRTARAVFELSDGRGLVLDDSRLLGHVHLYTNEELGQRLADVGIDPLSRSFTPEFLIEAARQSAKPAKLFLMEQKPVAGLGNIYSAEALFRARIHPARRMNTLRHARVVALHAGIQAVLRAAVREAIRSWRQPDHHDGMSWFVYGREGEPCLLCGRTIRWIRQAGRSSYYCPGCQRPSAI